MKCLYVLNKWEYRFLKTIGENVRKHRVQNDISQSQLAFEINTSLRQVQRIEKGEANSSIIYYYRIAEVLNISFEDFFKNIK